MKNDIFIELFRFNAKTDYLPYYQKHKLSYDESETINDLLVKMNSIEAFSYKENMNLKVNDLYTNASVLISDMVERFGNELRIDPISEFRAQKDLLIDRSDFIEKLSFLEAYMDAPTNIAYRKSTELVYYASNTLNYNRDYIGDHVLIIAADIIEKKFELKNEILEIVTKEENGIWYHTSLENRLAGSQEEQKIQRLIYLAKEYVKPKTALAKKVAAVLDKEEVKSFEEVSPVKAAKIAQEFSGFNIAAYHGVQESDLETLILDSKALSVKIPSAKVDLGAHSVLSDDSFSYKIAGDILIEAKDSNADFVLVKNEKTKAFFDQNQKEMEKLTGRDLGMAIVSQEQFVRLLEGEKDASALGFNEHKVEVPFLSNKRVF